MALVRRYDIGYTPWTAASPSNRPKGVLATHHDVDVSTAFELLRRHARNGNRKLHDVAAEVVAGTLRL